MSKHSSQTPIPTHTLGYKKYSTTQLLTRPFDDQLEFDENRKIKDECKYTINNSKFKIQNSKFIGKPDDKFETMLFLPETEGRKGEGGLRTKGYFKFSYENLMFNDECLILNDKDGNEFKVDNSKLNNSKFKIQHSTLGNTDTNTADFTPHISHLTSNNNTWYITDFYNNPIQPAPPEIQQKINDYFASINSTFNIQHSTLDNPDTSNSKFKIQHSTLDKLPLISIITVVFNGEKYLEETIQSVINQTYPNVEYIIIDGGSTDGTLDIIKKYEHAIDYWVSEPDRGIYDAMNKGIVLKMGKWVAFLGAGDVYTDYATQTYVNEIWQSEDIEYISSKIGITKGENFLRTVGCKWDWKIFSKYMNVGHVGSMHNEQLFKKLGLFDIKYNIAGDYDFLLRSGDKLRALFIDQVLAYMDAKGVSNSNIKVFKETYEAKIKNKSRSKLLSKIDMYVGIFKWRLRIIIYGC